jgi:hypothetical protein
MRKVIFLTVFGFFILTAPFIENTIATPAEARDALTLNTNEVNEESVAEVLGSTLTELYQVERVHDVPPGQEWLWEFVVARRSGRQRLTMNFEVAQQKFVYVQLFDEREFIRMKQGRRSLVIYQSGKASEGTIDVLLPEGKYIVRIFNNHAFDTKRVFLTFPR